MGSFKGWILNITPLKVKAEKPDEDIEDNIEESLKDSETLEKT